jgi:hypothetical protein
MKKIIDIRETPRIHENDDTKEDHFCFEVKIKISKISFFPIILTKLKVIGCCFSEADTCQLIFFCLKTQNLLK